MSQFVLDDQLDIPNVYDRVHQWTTVQLLRELRPFERILDDRVPHILLTLRQATFITIDEGFWKRGLCHPAYAILYFSLRDSEQKLIPGLLRMLLREPQFHTRAARMGKVARISTARVEYWEWRVSRLQRIVWKRTRRGA